jgi:hypothetical protein
VNFLKRNFRGKCVTDLQLTLSGGGSLYPPVNGPEHDLGLAAVWRTGEHWRVQRPAATGWKHLSPNVSVTKRAR